MTDVRALRSEYEQGALSEADLASNWLEQFRDWLEVAVQAHLPEPNAMTLATADAEGRPGARTVLLRGVDERGFSFYTNLGSRKGRELAANPRAALVFAWVALGRQVVVDGTAEVLADEESDAYFASRPWRSRLGAIASPQSEVIPSRAEIDDHHAELAERWPEGSAIPRPRGWGGFVVVPQAVEFWQGRRDRLHDRLRYRLTEGEWTIERLAP